AAERLHRDVVSADRGPRAGRAEAGDRAGDDLRIDALERGMIDAKAAEHAGAEIVIDDVGDLHEREEGGETFRVLEVEAEARLVALEREGEALRLGDALALRPQWPRRFRRRRLDPDHLGAEMTEDFRAVRPGD